MIRRLIFWRHGDYDHHYSPNLDAPLTAGGEAQARAVASRLLELKPDLGRVLILNSRARRTQQMTEALADVFPSLQPALAEWLGADVDLEALAGAYPWDEIGTLLASAHEPCIYGLLRQAGLRADEMAIKTGQMFEFSFDTETCELALIRRPD